MPKDPFQVFGAGEWVERDANAGVVVLIKFGHPKASSCQSENLLVLSWVQESGDDSIHDQEDGMGASR